MSTVARYEATRSRDRSAGVTEDAERSAAAMFEAFFEAAFHAQDAPRAWMSNNGLLAMTRLASPNKLNSCVSFLAKPL